MVDTPPTSVLRRRVAGIPVLYLAGGAVVILAVVAWRMRASNPETPSEDTGNDVPMETNQNDEAQLDSDGYAAFTAKGSITAAPPEKIETEKPEETNSTWLKKAVEARVKEGASAGTVQNALQAYLAGAQLTYAQGQERDRAIKTFGLPPNPPDQTNPVGAPAAPAKSQGPLPRGHKVTNGNDDTYAEIARIYYPTADSASVTLIANANRSRLTGTGPFSPGTIVQVPKYSVPKYYTSTKKTDTAAEIAKKNATSSSAIITLNPGMKFPVKAGTRVRVA